MDDMTRVCRLCPVSSRASRVSTAMHASCESIDPQTDVLLFCADTSSDFSRESNVSRGQKRSFVVEICFE